VADKISDQLHPLNFLEKYSYFCLCVLSTGEKVTKTSKSNKIKEDQSWRKYDATYRSQDEKDSWQDDRVF